MSARRFSSRCATASAAGIRGEGEFRVEVRSKKTNSHGSQERLREYTQVSLWIDFESLFPVYGHSRIEIGQLREEHCGGRKKFQSGNKTPSPKSAIALREVGPII